MEKIRCLECGALLEAGKTCQEYVNQLITWDFQDFLGVGQVHHLTVLSYNLQHPSIYSEKGLENAKRSLSNFINEPMAYSKHGAEDLKNLASNIRKWKIRSTADSKGLYSVKPDWKMNVVDVEKGGLSNYVKNVKKWSSSILKSLKESGNLE